MDKSNERLKRKKEYLEKLKDPRWQKKRLKVLERDEWCCQNCFDSESTLVVHHRYYLPEKEPWDYPLDALITMCEECHNDERENRSGAEQTLLHALREKFFSPDIHDLAIAFHEMPLLHQPEVVASVYGWAIRTPEIQKMLIDRYFQYLKERKKTGDLGDNNS